MVHRQLHWNCKWHPRHVCFQIKSFLSSYAVNFNIGPVAGCAQVAVVSASMTPTAWILLNTTGNLTSLQAQIQAIPEDFSVESTSNLPDTLDLVISTVLSASNGRRSGAPAVVAFLLASDK